MTAGRFIAVVGPSGVGKDSVIAGLLARQPMLGVARRAITRPTDSGGEAFDSMSEPAFAAHVAQGDFVLNWGAHQLFYGIPACVADDLDAGRDMLANLSRSVLERAAALFPGMFILNLTAKPATLAARLILRGRETEAEVATRLTRVAPPFPAGVLVVTLANDGALDDTVAAAFSVLYPPRQPAGSRAGR